MDIYTNNSSEIKKLTIPRFEFKAVTRGGKIIYFHKEGN